jgi:hypothetical protein
VWIAWGWRHWAQISFIMHCIGLLMEPMAMMRSVAPNGIG